MDPITIALGIWAGISTIGNILQFLENNELREKIEILNKIIEHLEGQIDELQRDYDSLRIWNIKKKAELRREIRILKNYAFQIETAIYNEDEETIDEIFNDIYKRAS